MHIYGKKRKIYTEASTAKRIRNSTRTALEPSSNLRRRGLIFSRKFPSTISRNNLSSTKKKKGKKFRSKLSFPRREKMNHRLTPLSLSLCVVTFYREGVLLYGRHIFSSFFSHLRFAEVFSTRRKWNSIRKIYKEEEGGKKRIKERR